MKPSRETEARQILDEVFNELRRQRVEITPVLIEQKCREAVRLKELSITNFYRLRGFYSEEYNVPVITKLVKK
jgi:hypothetical protein